MGPHDPHADKSPLPIITAAPNRASTSELRAHAFLRTPAPNLVID